MNDLLVAFRYFDPLFQGCRHWGKRGSANTHKHPSTPSLPPPSPLIIFWSKIFFLCKIGVDEREGVGEKSHKKWHKKEDVQSQKWCPSQKFFYVLFYYYVIFLLGFSWSSGNITTGNKKNTFQSQSVYLR